MADRHNGLATYAKHEKALVGRQSVCGYTRDADAKDLSVVPFEVGEGISERYPIPSELTHPRGLSRSATSTKAKHPMTSNRPATVPCTDTGTAMCSVPNRNDKP
jgi:hypothetical protein